MKNRGKNKKKQWRQILKNFSTELSQAKTEKELSSGGFVIHKQNKVKIVKGDKDAAKDNLELPTAGALPEKKVYRRGRAAILSKVVDIWAEPDATNLLKPTTASLVQSTEPVVPAGQSYNPSAVDHQILLLHVAKDEQKRLDAENPHKIAPKKSKQKKKPAELEALQVKVKSKHMTPKQLAKKMHTDLENIPKILKQIRKEEQDVTSRKQKRKLLAAVRKHENAEKFPISFQLPGELAPSLRKLRTDVYWMREMEFKRNKLPRARKTLGTKKATKSYVRRK